MTGPSVNHRSDGEAAERSLTYQRLRTAFGYPGPDTPRPHPALRLPQVQLAGPTFLEAFDPAVSEDACSLHEAEYAGEDRSVLFEELVRFYAFFGLSRDELSELPDHLTVELEFMHFLTFLEHRCALDGRPIEGLRRAQHDFLSRHLSRLARGIEGRCRSRAPYCVALVARLREFVESELGVL